MKSTFKRCRSAAIVQAAILIFIFGSAAPSVAADTSEPPSLTSIKMLSPAVRYVAHDQLPGDFVPQDTTVSVRMGLSNAYDGDLVYRDSLGGTYNVCLPWCGVGYDNVAVADLYGWQPGPIVLSHIELESAAGGRVVYWRDGKVEKFPSDMKDPAPIAIDWASFDFVLEPLRKYSNSPQTTVEGPPSVGHTLKVVLPILEPKPDPKPYYIEYRWMHEDALEKPIGYGPSYIPKTADVGHRIMARVRVYAYGYVPLESFSAPTAIVASPVQVKPAPVVFTDSGGTANDTYTIPATVGIEYLVRSAGRDNVVAAGTYSYSTADMFFGFARTKPDYILAPGAISAWSKTFQATPYLASPAAVTFTDKEGTNEDTYTIPATTGIDYLVSGRVVAAGTYPATGTVTATARAKPDYVLALGALPAWSTTFKSTPHLASPAAVTCTVRDTTSEDTYRLTGTQFGSGPGTGTAYPKVQPQEVEPQVESTSPAAAPVAPDSGPPVAAGPAAVASSPSSEMPSEPATASATEASTTSFSALTLVLTISGAILGCALGWFCRPVHAAFIRKRGRARR